jgi:thiol-disulfide isomerase/thioredoxin
MWLIMNAPIRRWRGRAVLLGGLAGIAAFLIASVASAGGFAERLDTRSNGERIIRLVEPRGRVAVPEIAFVDAQGGAHALSDFRGTPVAAVFWATWCVPCRTEMPALAELANALAAERFAILPISVDREGPDAVLRFYEEIGVASLPVFVTESRDAIRAFKIAGIPTTVFIDAEGNEIARVLGDRDWSDPEVIELVRRLIAGG